MYFKVPDATSIFFRVAITLKRGQQREMSITVVGT